MDISKCSWYRSFLWCNPSTDGSHGAERTPCTWSKDKTKRYTNNSGDNNDSPEHPTYIGPATRKTKLHTKHGENEQHHEQAESECTNKLRNGAMGRILRQQTVVHITTRTYMSTPPATFPNAHYYRTYHAYQSQQSYNGIEPTDNDVCNDNPIEGKTRSSKVSMKTFLCHLFNYYFFINVLMIVSSSPANFT